MSIQANEIIGILNTIRMIKEADIEDANIGDIVIGAVIDKNVEGTSIEKEAIKDSVKEMDADFFSKLFAGIFSLFGIK